MNLGSGSPSGEDHDCSNNKLPTKPEHVCDLLLHLVACKSVGSDGIHPRELAETIARPTNYFSMVLGIWRGPGQLETGKSCSNFQEDQERRPW